MLFKFSTFIFMLTLLNWSSSAMAQDFAWAKQFTNVANNNRNYRTILDAAGNVYTTGYFSGTVDFDPNAGTFNLTSIGSLDAFISKLDASGNFIWAKQFEGGGGSCSGNSIAVDAAGNIYTTGEFSGTVDFDPNAGTFPFTSLGTGQNMFISKLDANGNFVWAKRIGGTGTGIISTSITLDAAGNIYTTGYFSGTVNFDPSATTFNLTSAGQNDIFISKLDANGDFVWAKRMGSTINDIGYGITLDAAGNIYTTGVFGGTVDFDPNAATFPLTSAGQSDIFISKLDANGDFVWAKQFGGTSNEVSYSITLDTAGNIYTTGIFYGTVDFDPNAATFPLTSAGQSDIFISKLDANGNFVWAKGMGSTNNDFSYSITLDAAGNIYTTGIFADTVDFDPSAATFNLTSIGSQDAFISKLDANGNFVWAKHFGGTGANVISASIAVDAAGNVYATGIFAGTVDFDPSAATFNLTSTQNTSFILKLCGNGVTPAFTAVAPICAGATLAALPTTSTNNISGTWSPALNNTTTTTYTFTPATGQCADTTTLVITVNLLPNTATTNNGDTISAIETNATYQWLDCNNNNAVIAGATSQNFVATATGSYAVIVSNSSCSDTSACVNIIFTGINNHIIANDISIYPNPYSQEVYIELANFENTNVEIYSLNGQLLTSLNLTSNKTALPIQNLSSGMYLVKITNPAGISVKKLVKSE